MQAWLDQMSWPTGWQQGVMQLAIACLLHGSVTLGPRHALMRPCTATCAANPLGVPRIPQPLISAQASPLLKPDMSASGMSLYPGSLCLSTIDMSLCPSSLCLSTIGMSLYPGSLCLSTIGMSLCPSSLCLSVSGMSLYPGSLCLSCAGAGGRRRTGSGRFHAHVQG